MAIGNPGPPPPANNVGAISNWLYQLWNWIRTSISSPITLPLSISDGGTGATTATDARTALSSAKSGNNSDITSLSGLVTPISIAQGGTGATNATDARINLGITDGPGSVSPWVSVKDYGAIGNGIANDTAAIQAALDVGGSIFFPPGTYLVTSTLHFKVNGTHLIGNDRSTTSIISNSAIILIDYNSKTLNTLLWCGISGLFLKSTATANCVLDMTSWQFSSIDKCWVVGGNSGTVAAIKLVAIVATTEATYNIINDCYIGLCFTGIDLGYGANNNTIMNCRIQPSVAGGSAVFLYSLIAGGCSANSVIGCGFEYPGNITSGVVCSNGVDGILISGCRFEQLARGILVNTGCINANLVGNYYEGCSDNYLNLNANRNIRLDYGRLELGAGNGTAIAMGMGTIYSIVNGTANSGTSETNLMVYTLPASTLIQPYDYLEIDSWGICANNANNKSIRFYFGATTVFNILTVPMQNGHWLLKLKILSTSTATASVIATFICNNGATLLNTTTMITTPTDNLLSDVSIRLTGQSGTASSDITHVGSIIRYCQSGTYSV